MIYKIAYTGTQVVEIHADSEDDALDKFWDDGYNELYSSEIVEITTDYFKQYTDLN